MGVHLRLTISGHGCPRRGLHTLGPRCWAGGLACVGKGGSRRARKLSAWHLRDSTADSWAAVWAFGNREVSES